jgi:NAD(P)-dependent dehydrogenase (short-subunit alcohol dehydrogenase family)
MSRTVVITGSSQGIGEATAYYFAQDGCNIVITYKKEQQKADVVAEKCKRLGSPDVLVLELDVSNRKSIIRTINRIVNRFKKIDVLINNAGVLKFLPFENQNIEDIENQINTNLKGTILMTKYSLPYVSEAIINISSAWGKFVDPGASVYCATKFGIRGFTQALALENPNLNILSINPGLTSTELTGYEGVPPSKVGHIIFNAANKVYKVENGGDIDVWEILKS